MKVGQFPVTETAFVGLGDDAEHEIGFFELSGHPGGPVFIGVFVHVHAALAAVAGQAGGERAHARGVVVAVVAVADEDRWGLAGVRHHRHLRGSLRVRYAAVCEEASTVRCQGRIPVHSPPQRLGRDRQAARQALLARLERVLVQALREAFNRRLLARVFSTPAPSAFAAEGFGETQPGKGRLDSPCNPS